MRLEIRALTRKWAHVRSFIYMSQWHCLLHRKDYPSGQDSPFGEGVTRWNLMFLSQCTWQRFGPNTFMRCFFRKCLSTLMSSRTVECKSVRSKVVSIEGRFDRQKSIRSKTRVSSIEDCNYCLSVLNLLFIKSV